MRALALGLAMLAAAAPAIACVCSPPETAEQKREIAARLAGEAAAVVDLEQIAPMDHEAMRGERYRVVTVHVGQAPATFELDRGFHRSPDGSVGMAINSCEEVPAPGQRRTAVLYATASPSRFRIGDTCADLFVNTRGAVDLIRAEARKLAAERG